MTTKQFAARIEPYKTLLEALLLVLAATYGTVFLSRTWLLPSASFQVEIVESVRRGSYEDVVVGATFGVGDSANLEITKLETRCHVLRGSGQSCSLDCKNVASELRDGWLARNDTRTWACLASIPIDTCVELNQELYGRAAGFALDNSHWHTSTIHCTAAEAQAQAQ